MAKVLVQVLHRIGISAVLCILASRSRISPRGRDEGRKNVRWKLEREREREKEREASSKFRSNDKHRPRGKKLRVDASLIYPRGVGSIFIRTVGRLTSGCNFTRRRSFQA